MEDGVAQAVLLDMHGRMNALNHIYHAFSWLVPLMAQLKSPDMLILVPLTLPDYSPPLPDLRASLVAALIEKVSRKIAYLADASGCWAQGVLGHGAAPERTRCGQINRSL